VSAPRSRSLPNTRRTSKRTSVKKNRSRTRRPHIETLEDRCLLAVSPALLSTIEGLNSSDGIYNIGGLRCLAAGSTRSGRPHARGERREPVDPVVHQSEGCGMATPVW
jgi:hypothetical protein